MIRILLEILILTVIIAIAMSEPLQSQAIAIGSDMYELIRQSIALVFEHGEKILKNSK